MAITKVFAIRSRFEKTVQYAANEEKTSLSGMIEYADRYLSAEGPRTGILVVGAAHMIGETGVVRGLQALGYTVELAPDGR